jgi:uncharacterized DUF497 family protein
MKVEFSSEKNRINIQRHGISLADAEPVLFDPMAITIDDPDHDEFRYVTIGMDALMRIVVLVWTECGDDCCRLISARKAEPHEIKSYQ